MLHREPPPGRQRDGAGAHILAGEPAIGAALQAGRHDDAIAFDAAIFLHEHGIGAGRHRRAGENADRFAGLDRMARGVAGGDPIDDGEPLLAVGIEIAAAHRITVDRGIIERRHVDGSNDVFGKHAAASLHATSPSRGRRPA